MAERRLSFLSACPSKLLLDRGSADGIGAGHQGDAKSTAASPSLARRVAVGTIWLTAWRMASRMLGFISLLVLAQILFPADFGLVALAAAVAAAIDSFSQFGVRDALMRLSDDAEGHYDAAFTLQAGRGLLTGLALALCSVHAGDWIGDDRLGPVLLVLSCLAVVSGWENIGTVALARHLDFRSQVLLQAVPRTLGVVATIGAAVLLRTYWALIAGLVVTKVLTLASGYLVAPHRPRFSLRGWQYLLNFSTWSWLGSIVVLIWSRADTFLLGPLLGPAVLGLYVMSVEVAILPVTEIIEPFGNALYSGFAFASRSGTMGRDMALRVAGSLSVCMVPLSIGISACSGYLAMALLGPKWSAAQPLIEIFTPLCVLSPFSYVCGSALAAQGHIRRAVCCNAVAASVKCAVVVTTLYLTHDIKAVAAVNVGTVAVQAAMFVWQMCAVGGRSPFAVAAAALGPLLRVLAAAAAAAAAAACLPGAWQVVDLSRTAALLVGGMIGVGIIALYFGLLFGFWMLAGRPDGPERDLAALCGRSFSGLRAQRLAVASRA